MTAAGADLAGSRFPERDTTTYRPILSLTQCHALPRLYWKTGLVSGVSLGSHRRGRPSVAPGPRLGRTAATARSTPQLSVGSARAPLHSEIFFQFRAEPFGFFLFQTAGRCDRSPLGQLQFKVVPNLVARLKIRSELKVLNRGSRDHARSRETQTGGADVEFTVQNLDSGCA